MEKINYHEHEPDWIDGLLAITDSTRRILLALKRSRSSDNSLTLEEFIEVNNLEGSCRRSITRKDTKLISDEQACQILASIAEQGIRPFPSSFDSNQ